MYYATGTKAYMQLCTLIGTLLVLRLLTVNFPTQYDIKFTGQILLIDSPQNYKSCIAKAIDACQKMINHSPAVIFSLELGYSTVDAVDNLLAKCAC